MTIGTVTAVPYYHKTPVERLLAGKLTTPTKFVWRQHVRCCGRMYGMVQKMRRGFAEQAYLDSEDPQHPKVMRWEGGGFLRDEYGYYMVQRGDTVQFFHESEMEAA